MGYPANSFIRPEFMEGRVCYPRHVQSLSRATEEGLVGHWKRRQQVRYALEPSGLYETFSRNRFSGRKDHKTWRLGAEQQGGFEIYARRSRHFQVNGKCFIFEIKSKLLGSVRYLSPGWLDHPNFGYTIHTRQTIQNQLSFSGLQGLASPTLASKYLSKKVSLFYYS